ncbi:hypothetical protein ACROYT_G044446 [Oculina patagonica]
MTFLTREHVTQFAPNVALEKCVEDWIHRRIGNQDKVDDEPQGTSEGAEVGEETDAPVVASEFPGKVKQTASCDDEYHEREDLKDDNPGDLHEQGVSWVVSVREDGGETKEENWSHPCCNDHNPDRLSRHERNVPEGPCDGKEAVNGHGEDAGVRTVEEGEAYFEEDTGMSKINREEAKLDEKDRWEEG